jgi:hypothetical protein
MSSWTQIGDSISGQQLGEEFGWRVDINNDGTIVACSAQNHDTDKGTARVYKYSGGKWSQLGNDIDGLDDYNRLRQVSLSDDGLRLLIAERGYESGTDSSILLSEGKIRVFEYNSGTNNWDQLGSDINGKTNSQSGWSAKINGDGTRFILGGRYYDSPQTNIGVAQVFEYSGGEWVQLGSDLSGENQGDMFGDSVAINNEGNKIAINAIQYDNGGLSNTGKIYFYEYISGSWSAIGTILGTIANQKIGSIELNSAGDRIIFGSFQRNEGYIYENTSGSTWSQLGNTIVGTGDVQNIVPCDINGEGNIVTIGEQNTDVGGTDRGKMTLYEYNSGTDQWDKKQEIYGDANNSSYGTWASLNLLGDYVAVGAARHDTGGTDTGRMYVYYNSAYSSNSSDVSTDNVSNASASTTLKNEVVTELNSIAGVSIDADDISASVTIVSTKDNVDYQFTVTIANVNLSNLSGAEQTSLINVLKSRYATDLSIDSSRIAITLSEGSIDAGIEILSAPAQSGSGNGKTTVKLLGRITVKGTGKITVK